MSKLQNFSSTKRERDIDIYSGAGTSKFASNKKVKSSSSEIIINEEFIKSKVRFSANKEQSQIPSIISNLLLHDHSNEELSTTTYPNAKDLFRLFVKNGDYVYARPDDIVMMESCDHLVKVYVAFDDTIKKTVRANTLKDFLLQLPKTQFLRIGRFCAVNTRRLSGGNYNDQTFEFDFKVSIKLKHAISLAAFGTIGK
ncbi:LytTR family transcriptional regulator DNA-binding domain-containing protein [Segetibacter aerophilus]|uniref:HTH LytTR-type domain-containing protein n=1 Tax=Segetibacter aerophilus TaxID=670293 RepID=A0A512BIZ7_9BACT|nr:LytTR family transcriptional regulator DNA-binding domain-containing protein [Segetibacter aerophilus]GEO11940.1 hypothetical protein SAE01_44360 [Segetibacter aerophilus]